MNQSTRLVGAHATNHYISLRNRGIIAEPYRSNKPQRCSRCLQGGRKSTTPLCQDGFPPSSAHFNRSPRALQRMELGRLTDGPMLRQAPSAALLHSVESGGGSLLVRGGHQKHIFSRLRGGCRLGDNTPVFKAPSGARRFALGAVHSFVKRGAQLTSPTMAGLLEIRKSPCADFLFSRATRG